MPRCIPPPPRPLCIGEARKFPQRGSSTRLTNRREHLWRVSGGMLRATGKPEAGCLRMTNCKVNSYALRRAENDARATRKPRETASRSPRALTQRPNGGHRTHLRPVNPPRPFAQRGCIVGEEDGGSCPPRERRHVTQTRNNTVLIPLDGCGVHLPLVTGCDLRN